MIMPARDKISPRLSMAQIMRASLLATAATTTLKGRRLLTACRDPDQRPGAVHELSPQIAVAALADAEQPLPAAGRVLARGEAEPGGEAAAAAEQPRIHDCCDQ